VEEVWLRHHLRDDTHLPGHGSELHQHQRLLVFGMSAHVYCVKDETGRDRTGRDRMGRDRKNGTGWDGTGRDGTGRDRTGRYGTGRDGTGRDGAGRHATKSNNRVLLLPGGLFLGCITRNWPRKNATA
jgi:hypothetical protein